jgi:small subunit ribosomal protein S18
MSDRGKIRARRVSGLSVQNQRAVAKAIKLARELALVPYATRTVTERATPRSRPPRDDRPRDTELPDVIEIDEEDSLLPEEDDE